MTYLHRSEYVYWYHSMYTLLYMKHYTSAMALCKLKNVLTLCDVSTPCVFLRVLYLPCMHYGNSSQTAGLCLLK